MSRLEAMVYGWGLMVKGGGLVMGHYVSVLLLLVLGFYIYRCICVVTVRMLLVSLYCSSMSDKVTRRVTY